MDEIPAWMDGVAFTVADGRAVGLTDARMRHARFERPHHGVRLLGTGGRIDDGGVIDRCRDLRTVLASGVVFSHATAAHLWGIPLPAHLSNDLHVVSPGAVPVRRPGVIGWTRRGGAPAAHLAHGLPVTSPADTWVSLATMARDRGGAFTREWLVAAGDFLVSGRRTKRGRAAPLATIDELMDAMSRHGSRRGATGLAWAVTRVRSPVDSPPETFLRLGLVAARLPEPAVQPEILTAAGIRHPDLGYLAERVLIEYLGDVHRTDRDTWRTDLTRVQLFNDAGFEVMLVGADDIGVDGMRALAARVRRALARPR
jgi:hypothetical protein